MRVAQVLLRMVCALAFLGLAAGASADTIYVDDDAPDDPGPGDPLVSDPLEDGSAEHPFDAIQEGINAAVDDDTVLILDGTYTGLGNKELDFAGRQITVRSESGPGSCIIDCEDDGRGFRFQSGETRQAVLDGVTISNGRTSGGGAGIYCYESSPTIQDCIVRDNTCTGHNSDGGGIVIGESAALIAYCIIESNHAAGDNSTGGGIYCTGDAVEIEHCTIRDNIASAKGGGVASLGNGNATIIRRCMITGNAAFRGAGVWLYNGGTTTYNCVIANNYAECEAGAIYSEGGGHRIWGCVVRDNLAANGPAGGVYCYLSDTTITNCTIVGNRSVYSPGGLYVDRADPAVSNCIIWNNTLGSFRVGNHSTLTATHNNIEGGCPGEGNFSADPKFAFPTDYRLMTGSPCIDKGTNDPPGGLPAEDIDGNDRVLAGGPGTPTADVGAFEYNPQQPSIALSAEVIEFCAPSGGPNPDEQALSVRNCGGGTLNWAISGLPSWLGAVPAAGQSAGEIDAITLSVDAQGLTAGRYTAELVVEDDQAANSPRNIVAVLVVYRELHVPVAYATIQQAIDAAVDGDVVILADGIHSGPGNRDIRFGGKAITVQSANGPANCTIDGEAIGCGFIFDSGENQESVVMGITIANGYGIEGGGIHCNESSPLIIDCVFSNCAAADDGGAIYCFFSFASIERCSFIGNASGSYGGAVFSMWGGLSITDCTLVANSADGNGGGFCGGTLATTLADCVIQNNSAGSSGDGGGIWAGGATISRCLIEGNVAGDTGGGVSTAGYYGPTLLNCLIRDNSAGEGGGGVSVDSDCDLFIASCIISGNQVLDSDYFGGGIRCDNSTTIVNCTIFGNSAGPGDSKGGGIAMLSDSNYDVQTIANTIVWNNAAHRGKQIYVSGATGPGQRTISFSDVHGGEDGIAGPGGFAWVSSFELDPLFADPGNGDFHLTTDSPCIGAGDPATIGVGDTDIDNEPRIMGGRVDIGADEFTDRPFVFGDMNCDGVRDGFDIDAFVLALLGSAPYYAAYPECDINNADCDADGVVDGFDIDPFVELLGP